MALPTPLQAFSGVPKINTAPDKQTIVDGEKMTGAQALIRSLEDLGVEDVFGRSGKAQAVLEAYGFTPAHIAAKAKEALALKK